MLQQESQQTLPPGSLEYPKAALKEDLFLAHLFQANDLKIREF